MSLVADEVLLLGSKWRVWWHLAVDDVWVRYRRTLLGPFWITISQAAWIYGVFLMREVFGNGADMFFLQYLTVGVVVFNTISQALSDGPNTLVRASGLLLSYRIAPLFMIVRGLVGALLTLAHSIPIFLFVAVYTKYVPTSNLVMLPVGLACLVIFLLGIYLALGALGARYRDLGPAAGSIAGVMFILTPVLWVGSDKLLMAPIVAFNPFYYMLEAVRQPMLDRPMDMDVFLIAFCISIVTLIAGMITYTLQRKEIAYWL